MACATAACSLQAQSLYSFGNPTPDEQLYLEYINRSRANPPAEGARLAATTDAAVLNAYSIYNVNLALMQSEFKAIPAAPPLAPSAALTTVARSHSQWMLANATQSHDEGPLKIATRMATTGFLTWGENVYAYSNSTWFGHAGLNVDWGPGGSGGMQSGRGHRTNIHNSIFKEIGIGVVNGTNGGIGPQLVTQDLGVKGSTAFATGVAYYDLNSNNFYDPGEGISDLDVNVSGASYYCKTASGGGWVVPVPTSAADRTVTFSGLSLNQSSPITIPAATNAKLDLKLAYAPPAITSPATAYTGSPYNMSFTAVGGAGSYRWKRWTAPAAAAENAENTTKITSSILGGYSVVNSGVKQQGSSSFHLVNASPPGTQWIQLSPLYRGLASASLSFQSRLRTAMPSEQYKVQVKEEGSSNWVDVYSQTGVNSAGEASFSLKTADLSAMEGKLFRVRFLLQFSSGSYWGNSGNTYGWFIDAINFSKVQELQNEVSDTLASTTGSFTPPATGTYLHAIFPVISGLDFPPSFKTVTVNAGPPPGFASWAAAFETANSIPAGTLSDPDGDYDQDGRPNLVEYGFGTSPVLGTESMARYPAPSTSGSDVIVSYQIDTSLGDISYFAEAGTELGTWSPPGQAGAPAGFKDQLVSTNGSIETREATLPTGSGSQVFFRVRVAPNP
ncbi:CAP domain-containing protein [Haloferula sp. BvORR071]|uniref:CAP domain-containing protein n=1 Tax=Haloferula sp. BvORR071 TaxID=1396141 RepID=UPI00224102FD|nr:CAP domain-containing protein [Haloferula sp. BvORR071]